MQYNIVEMASRETPKLASVALPVHNEGTTLRNQLPQMVRSLRSVLPEFELVLCENGSTDDTLEQIRRFQADYPEIRFSQIPAADYGLALKRALSDCRGEYVFIFNADFWSADFVRSGVPLLGEYDLVIGSKAMAGATDQRPLFRRLITRSFNTFLRLFYGFRGTDTHGLKALRRTSVQPLVEQCVTNHFVFDTELVLRAQRKGLKIKEIPVRVQEMRQPTVRSLIARGPKVTGYLIQLWFALRKAL